MEKRRQVLTCLILFFLLIVEVLMSVSAPFLSRIAGAEGAAYTSALDDLKKDEAFKPENYPEDNNYSLSVIQIAESTKGELFVYVYQPCVKSTIEASSINISTSINDNLKYKNYKLALLNKSGVFGKYRVEDFTVKADALRYYDILSIYRKWNAAADPPVTSASQTISEKSYGVGQLWTAATVGDTVTYQMTEIEVIRVTDQFVGFRRYSNGIKWSAWESCDAHFIAFSTDHDMDKIISADLEFNVTRYGEFGGKTEYFETEHKAVTLYDYEKAGNEGGWFDGGKYIWDRIARTSDYVADMQKQGIELKSDETDTFKRYDWILNFYETEYTAGAGGRDWLLFFLTGPVGLVMSICDSITENGYFVSDVTLMRLEFETDNVIYNLGVVSDKQTGSLDPIGEEESAIGKAFSKLGDMPWWGWLIIAIVVLLLLCMIKPVFEIVVTIVKGIVFIITLPFKAIGAVINNVSSHGKKKKKKSKKSEDLNEKD